MLIIAKTWEGAEFYYYSKTAHAVSKASATKICKILNEFKYQIAEEEHEKWFIYDIGLYDTAYDYAKTQAFRIRKGIVMDCK